MKRLEAETMHNVAYTQAKHHRRVMMAQPSRLSLLQLF